MASSGDIKAGRAYVQVSTDDKELQQGLLKMSKQLDVWSKRVIGIGLKTMMAAGAMGLPLAGAMTVYGKFEMMMSKVAAITKATTSQVRKLREQAILLGKTTFFTTSQVANAQKFLGMAGFNAEQILAGLPSILDLALAGDLDIGQAADIATNISTPFKIAAKDISRVSDVIAMAVTSSNTNVQEMGDAFTYAAAGAASAGQTVEEVGAAIAILANNGIKASMAGTALRKMLITLADADVQKKLKEQFQIDVTDQSGNIRPLMTVMRELNRAIASATPSEKNALMFDLFGDRAGNAAIVIAGAGNQIDDFRLKMEGATGSARAMAKTMADNIGGDWIAFTSAIEGVQIAVGESFNNMGRSALQALTLGTRGIATWIGENRKMVIAAGAGAAGLGVLGAGLVGLGLTLKIASVGMYTLSAGIGLLSGTISLPIRLFRGLATASLFLSRSLLSTRTASLIAGTAIGTFGVTTKILQGIFAGLRVALTLLQAGMYALIGVAYTSLAAFTGLRAAFYGIYASSQIAYTGIAVFQVCLRTFSASILAVSFNFRAWVVSLFAVKTATQAAGTALVVYNSATRSSVAGSLILGSSTKLLTGGFGSVARLTRSAGTALVTYTAGTRLARSTSTGLAATTSLVRAGFLGITVTTYTAGVALLAYSGGLKVSTISATAFSTAQALIGLSLTKAVVVLLAARQAILAMSMAASVASVRLLFFKAGTLAVQAGVSLLTAKLFFGRSAMLAWMATSQTVTGTLTLLQVGAKLTGLAFLNALLLPMLKIGLVIGAGIAVWYLFGEAIQSALGSALQSATDFFGWIGSGLQTLWSDFSQYMGMIGDLLLDGNLTEAAKVVWELLLLEWERGCLAISQHFGATIDKMREMFGNLMFDFANMWENNKRGDSVWGKFVASITSLATGVSYEDIVADMNRQAEYGLEQNAKNRPQNSDDYARERAEMDKQHQTKIDEIQGRLNTKKAEHTAKKEQERQEIEPNIAVSDTDIELTRLKIELNDAIQAKDMSQVGETKGAIEKVQAEKEKAVQAAQEKVQQAEYEKAKAASQKAKEEFEAAVADLNKVKTTNDKAAILTAQKRVKKTSDDVESSIGHESLLRSQQDLREQNNAPKPETPVVTETPKVDLTQLKIELADAQISGDENRIKTAKDAVAQAELEKAKSDCLAAADEYRLALKEVEQAKQSGNTIALNQAQDHAQSAAEKVDQSQSTYESMKERLKKGLNETQNKFSVSGSFSAAAIRSMGAGSSMDRVAKATEKSEKHLEKLVNQETKPEKQAVGKKTGETKKGEGEDSSTKELKQQTRYLRDISEKGFTSKFS